MFKLFNLFKNDSTKQEAASLNSNNSNSTKLRILVDDEKAKLFENFMQYFERINKTLDPLEYSRQISETLHMKKSRVSSLEEYKDGLLANNTYYFFMIEYKKEKLLELIINQSMVLEEEIYNHHYYLDQAIKTKMPILITEVAKDYDFESKSLSLAINDLEYDYSYYSLVNSIIIDSLVLLSRDRAFLESFQNYKLEELKIALNQALQFEVGRILKSFKIC